MNINYFFESNDIEKSMSNLRRRVAKYYSYLMSLIAVDLIVFHFAYQNASLGVFLFALSICLGFTGLVCWTTVFLPYFKALRYVVVASVLGAIFAVILATYGVSDPYTSTIVIGYGLLGLTAAYGSPQLMIWLFMGGSLGGFAFLFLFPENWTGQTDFWEALKVHGSLVWQWSMTCGLGYIISRVVRTTVLQAVEGEQAAQTHLKEVKRFQETEAEKQQQDQKRQRYVGSLTDGFQQTVSATVDSLGGVLDDFQQSVESMTKAQSDTTDKTKGILSSGEQAIQIVNKTVEETTRLASATSNILEQVENSNTIGREAVAQITQARNNINELEKSARDIGGVLDIITDIATQTNMLALNATIEAARAGESGKGFAVVAMEVKKLANQTAEATSKIAEKITMSQNLSKESRDQVEAVAETIARIDAALDTVKSAVTEQETATRGIQHSIDETQNNVQQVDFAARDIHQAIDLLKARLETIESGCMHIDGQRTALSQSADDFVTALNQE